MRKETGAETEEGRKDLKISLPRGNTPNCIVYPKRKAHFFTHKSPLLKIPILYIITLLKIHFLLGKSAQNHYSCKLLEKMV